ncbi:Major facilitator-type transporter psiT2 [Psilocybe cubensis]|uniref:Major facilitator-type transporter psiT2 n=1 Tax=Psilocybe cubensis TaxID=181762 RepID=A0ACB8H3I4_PSICU|nr:Major facilitator-type transporter psiT2 [Psilocybe cubensis]KAH9481774.1 Major facilitator-type transporter psiT2 [Psilocybe cubensis]
MRVYNEDSEREVQSTQVNEGEADKKQTPLPILPLLSVFLIQLGEPIAATVIYPFIAQFVREMDITGGDEKKIGYYAGIIESAFFFSQGLSVVQWGYLSDRYGRRPILLCGPLGVAFSMLMFGSSTTFAGMVAARCLQGIFNGNIGKKSVIFTYIRQEFILCLIGISKSVIAELTDSTNRGDAFAFIPLMWSIGSTTGPILGGSLSNPATRWPETLGHISYLKTHPYFLPCFVAAFFAFISFLIVCFVLEETLPSKATRIPPKQNSTDVCSLKTTSPLLEHGEGTGYGSSTDAPGRSNSNQHQHQGVRTDNFRDAFTRPVMSILLNYAFLAFLDMCYGVLLPLMYSTSIRNGGLGLDPSRIGATLGAFGLVNSIVQLNFLGRFIRKYGPRKRAGEVDHIVIACMTFQLACQMFIFAAYGSIQVLLVESIPEGGPLGTVNGVSQMIGAAMRCIAPTFASSLFSVSLQRNLAGGNMVYYILITIALLGICCTRLLPSGSKKRMIPQSQPTA